MDRSLPRRLPGTHLPAEVYTRKRTGLPNEQQQPSMWFLERTPAGEPPPPSSERPTVDFGAALTQPLPVVSEPPATDRIQPAPAHERTASASLLSDPQDIAFRDRLLRSLKRIGGLR